MLDKLLFNNGLNSNKSKVQQAKVNTINKLVHKIRKLNQLNDKQPDNKKLSGKLEKTTIVLSYIKKVKNVELLKRALLNKKNPINILTDGKSSPEEIAYAILFNHKIIKDIVKRMINIFNLNESNPNWREEISELSKKEKKTLRTEGKKKLRKERKDRNELTKKRIEWLEENLPSSLKDDYVPEVKSIKEEIVGNDWRVEDISKNATKKTKPEKEIKENKSERSNKEIPIKDERNIDPFFITQTGKNYVSSVTVDCTQSNGPKNSHHIPRTNDNQHLSNNQKKMTFSNKKPVITGKSKLSNNFNNQKSRENQLSNKKNSSEQMNNGIIKELKEKKISVKENKSNGNDLHPSWAAKQKMKAKITEFKGTKIVFNDDN